MGLAMEPKPITVGHLVSIQIGNETIHGAIEVADCGQKNAFARYRVRVAASTSPLVTRGSHFTVTDWYTDKPAFWED